MIDPGTLLGVGAAFFVVTASPGPGNLAGASVSLTQGRRSGFLFAAGLASGLIAWGLLAATGMGAVLHGSTIVLTALKLMGGLYLLWLAFESGRAALRSADLRRAPPGRGRWYLRGLLLNLSNPKAVLAWMAAFSVGLGPEDGISAVAAATFLCVAISLLNAAAWAWVVSLQGVVAGYRRVRRGIDACLAGLFALSGLALIRSAITR